MGARVPDPIRPSPPLRPMPAGRYAQFTPVGEGGMGIVYWALDTELNRQVALKVLPPGIAADGKSVTRFVREAQVAGKLHWGLEVRGQRRRQIGGRRRGPDEEQETETESGHGELRDRQELQEFRTG